MAYLIKEILEQIENNETSIFEERSIDELLTEEIGFTIGKV